MNEFSLASFEASGRVNAKFVVWYFVKLLFFLSPLPWPSLLKTFILRSFGCQVGSGVVIKPRINIHMPGSLSLGNNVWLGEGVEIYNLDKVAIGNDTCISQQCLICAAGHDYRSPDFAYRNLPISIGDRVWLQARVFVAPGSVVESDCVVLACSAIKGRNYANSLYSSGFASKLDSKRW